MNSQPLLNRLNPDLGLVLGATAISFSGVWVALAEVSPTNSAFYRVFFGSIFLLLLTLNKPGQLLANKSHVLLAILCGLLFALDLFCWHRSIVFVGPGLATLLGNFQVFILAGVGVFLLGERYTSRLLLAIPLAVAGLFLLVGVDWPTMSPSYRQGIYYGLATAAAYSAYIFSLKRLSSTSCGKVVVMFLVSLTTALFLGGYILLTNDTFFIPDLPSLFSLAALGLFSQCLGWLLIAFSLPRTNTSSAGLILLLQPALSFLWDVLFFHRPTTPLNWLGVFLALFAIYLGISAKKPDNSSAAH